MESAKLVVDLITALAWPVAVVGIVVMFRGPIAERIEDVRKAKLPGGIEVELDEAQRRIERVEEQLPVGTPDGVRRELTETRAGLATMAREVKRLEAALAEREIAAIERHWRGPRPEDGYLGWPPDH